MPGVTICRHLYGHGCLLRTAKEASIHWCIHGPLIGFNVVLLVLRVRHQRTRRPSTPERMSTSLLIAACIFELWGSLVLPLVHCSVWNGLNLRVATLLYGLYEFGLLQYPTGQRQATAPAKGPVGGFGDGCLHYLSWQGAGLKVGVDKC